MKSRKAEWFLWDESELKRSLLNLGGPNGIRTRVTAMYIIKDVN